MRILTGDHLNQVQSLQQISSFFLKRAQCIPLERWNIREYFLLLSQLFSGWVTDIMRRLIFVVIYWLIRNGSLRNHKKKHVLLTAHYITSQFNILMPTFCKSSLAMCHVINFNFRFAKYVLCRNKCGYPYALRCNVRQFNFCALAII